MSDGATASTPKGPGFLRHVLNYGSVSVVGKVLGLLMLPLYTRWLSESEYGAVAITDLVLVVLAELFGRHLLAGMSRNYFLRQMGKQRDAVISSTTVVVIVVSWVVCGVALFFSDDLAPLFLGSGDSAVGPDRLSTLLTLTLLILPCQLTSQAGFAYLQIVKQSRLYAIIQLAKMLFELVLKVVLLGVFGWGVEGFVTSVLVGEAITATLLTGGILMKVGVRFEGAAVMPIVRFSLPLIPVGACQLGLHQLDRRLLEHLAPGDLGLSWTGIYGLGYLVGATPIAVLLNALFGIWQPSIYAIEDDDERGRALARGTTWMVLVVAGIAALTALFGRPLVDFLAGREGFRAAYEVVPWVACGYAFWAFYAAVQLSFYAASRTGALIPVNALALAANVGLNWFLVPRFGYVGAAQATLGTFAVLAATAVLVGRGACPVPFHWGRILAALVFVLVLGAVAIQVDRITADWGLFASLALRLGLLFGAITLLLGPFLKREERAGLFADVARRWADLRARRAA